MPSEPLDKLDSSLVNSMPEMSSYIKLNRNTIDWTWFKNGNILKVWIYLLINAYYKPGSHQGVRIERGQLATTYSEISDATDMTYDQIRTAIKCLKRSGSVTITRCSKFLVISINNYDDYQGQTQSNPNQIPITSQSQGNIQYNNKNLKERKESISKPRPRKWEKEEQVPPGLIGRFPTKQDYLNWRDGEPDEV